MNNIKKIFALVLVLGIVFSFVSCGTDSKDGADGLGQSEQPSDKTEQTDDAADGTNADELTKLTVGASPAPHAEILENVKDALLEEGVELEIVEFTDYLLPNIALQDGDIDANYFQHAPFLSDFNAENDADLAVAGKIHYEPLGIYPGKSSDIKNVPDGAVIGIPDDSTNGARALLLLESQGVITLEEGVAFSKLTKLNIVENPHNVEITELEAVLLPVQLPDMDFAVINGNYALGSGVADTVIVTEDENSVAIEYVNVVAVQSGNEKNDAVVKLINALKSENSKKFIEDSYGQTVIVYEGE